MRLIPQEIKGLNCAFSTAYSLYMNLAIGQVLFQPNANSPTIICNTVKTWKPTRSHDSVPPSLRMSCCLAAWAVCTGSALVKYARASFQSCISSSFDAICFNRFANSRFCSSDKKRRSDRYMQPICTNNRSSKESLFICASPSNQLLTLWLSIRFCTSISRTGKPYYDAAYNNTTGVEMSMSRDASTVFLLLRCVALVSITPIGSAAILCDLYLPYLPQPLRNGLWQI